MRAHIWRNLLVIVGLVVGGLGTQHDPSASEWQDRAPHTMKSGSPEYRPLAGEAAASLQQRINDDYVVPLSFEPNQGQTDPQVKFLSRGRGYTLFLTATEAVVSMRRRDIGTPNADAGMRHRTTTKGVDEQRIADPDRQPLILRMQPIGANPTPRVSGESELPGDVNYVRGGDPKASITGVPTYARVRYEDIYPGVDLVYYGNGHQLEYDFIVAAGADPARIRLEFTGAEKLTVNADGELVLHTAAGALPQPKPMAYQEIDGVRSTISGSYVLTGADRIGFRLGAYDRTRPLIIDPVLAYSTYFGGNSDEIGWDIAIDAGGNAYVAGTRPSVRFPDSQDFDAFVAKFSTGGALLWVTDVGDRCDDDGRGIAVDSGGNAYLTGEIGGICYPYPELTPGASWRS